MTAVAGDMPSWPLESAKRDRVVICVEQTLGASGAIGALVTDDNGVVLTKGATGVYTMVFPKAIRANIQIMIKSAAGTLKTVWITAIDAVAGTAGFTTGNGGGTAADGAAGDILFLELLLDQRSDA